MAVAAPLPGPIPAPSADEHVFLIGRPPIAEYLGFLEQTIESQTIPRGKLMEQWRAANDHIRQLERDEAGYADSPPVQPLPADVTELGRQLLNDPITQASFDTLPYELGIVELDRLVVFQKQINVAYVRELCAALGDSPSSEKVFRFALPFDRRYDPPVQCGQIAPNVWSFASPSQDFRPLEATLINPRQVPGLQTTGAPVAIVALLVGYGSNYLSAISVENRFVLNNGSHRAYALRTAGITHAPCLIRKVSRREELELAGSDELRANPERYLESARPPVLRDYFDGHLRLTVHLRRRNTQVRVMVNVEKSLAPGV